MCHSRFSDKLVRFADGWAPQQFLREITDTAAPPGDDELLHAENAPLLPGYVLYFHLDGSRDVSREIAFLAGDERRILLLNIPLSFADEESQHRLVSVSVLRSRIRLNGGRGEGAEEDFRFLVDRYGTWILRLRSGDTPHGSSLPTPVDSDDEENTADEVTNRLDIVNLPTPTLHFQPSQFGTSSRHGTPTPTPRHQRQRMASTRL